MSWKVTKELKEKQAAAFAQAEEIRGFARKDNREMNAEEKSKHDALLSDVERYGRDIELEVKAGAIGESLDKRNVGRSDVETRSISAVPEKDAKRYSILRAITRIAEHKQLDGIEGEMHQEMVRMYGQPKGSFWFPTQMRAFDTSAAVGAIQPRVDAANFIDQLRVATIAGQLGARFISDVNGKLQLPRLASGATAYWVTEGNSPTASAAALDSVSFVDKTVGAYTDVTRSTLNQASVDVESIITGDLVKVLGAAIDKAVFQGSGASGQPYGIINTASIPTVAMGTNGLAPTRAKILEMESTLAQANASGNYKFVTTPQARAKMKVVDRGTDTGKYLWADDNSVEGYQALASNQIPSNLTKGSSSGVCSAAILGDFSEVLIPMWGGLDLNVDPFSLSSSGGIRLVALQSIDIGLRHLGSFAVIKDFLTT